MKPVARHSLSILFSGMLLAGCQTPLGQLQELATANDRQIHTLPGSPFPLVIAAPQQIQAGQRLRVYLEGDGHAWIRPNQPSLDPSPRQLLVAELAFADPMPAIYLARPCQFVSASSCHNALWTSRRYAEEVVHSLDLALDQLKQRYANRDFELIGYSGGATLALLLALRRDDVTQVQTLAGNLSPRQWVQLHNLSPLSGSLEPLDQSTRLAQLHQRHLFGADDQVLPPLLLQRYREALGPAACLQSAVLHGVSHHSGWAQAWQQWQTKPLECR